MRPSPVSLPGIMPLKLRLRLFAGLALPSFLLLSPSPSLPAGPMKEAQVQVVLTLETDGNERGLPEGLHGWVSVQPAGGGVAAVLFSPGAGNFALTLPENHSGIAGISWRLAGVTPAGRPAAIRPDPAEIEAAASKALAGPSQRPLSARVREKIRRVRARLRSWRQSFKTTGKALTLIALAASLITAGLLLAGKYGRSFWQPGSRNRCPPEGDGQEKLLLLAQVESLQKEKAGLAAKLNELEAKLKRAAAEKADLSAELEQHSQRAREKAEIVADLEMKLQDAKHEADAVQQEYMALYARDQEGKGVLRRG